MKVLLDTSVLVAALVEAHPRHDQAFPWLSRLRQEGILGSISAHSIAETYAVLSALPVSPRITPSAAWALIEHSVLPFVGTVALTGTETGEVARRLSRQGLSGGIVYDALIAEAAVKAGVEVLLTLNPRDFRRVVLADRPELREP